MVKMHTHKIWDLKAGSTSPECNINFWSLICHTLELKILFVFIFRYNRRKYSEIMAEKTANAAGKKFRKKKKFRN